MFLQIILKFFNTYYMNKFGYSNIMPIRETFRMGGGDSQFLYIVQKGEGSLKKNPKLFIQDLVCIFLNGGLILGQGKGQNVSVGGAKGIHQHLT